MFKLCNEQQQKQNIHGEALWLLRVCFKIKNHTMIGFESTDEQCITLPGWTKPVLKATGLSQNSDLLNVVDRTGVSSSATPFV